ncbi:hypothetical protein B0T19DRAFT_197023 [Cercophora scortea]|uniref:PLD phosphodiesterase domain-containing protein n=1 Tax=Cercophora scortea TaxID=314031 RepID=A0AAE0MF24_9PEZI|nr:hypothetical protein B0T19DRAFT_197023 [Cercophora scortea]
MSYSASFVHEFVRRLQEQQPHTPRQWQSDVEFPRYDMDDASDRDLLVSSSTPLSFQLGTGASIFTQTLIPAITSATSEVIFVTCFWAPSKTLSALHDALTKLATHRRHLISGAESRGAPSLPPLTVRICLSSRSLLQKLLHPQSRHGHVCPPSSWEKEYGLPDPALLEAGGIQLQVKSLFFLPFSVMHPKFVIIDRQRAFVPSCNVSWESWLEGCVEITGDAVLGLMSFYSLTWERNVDYRKAVESQPVEGQPFGASRAGIAVITSTAQHHATVPTTSASLPTVILPSSHHRNPHFHPFPWQTAPKVPTTPLNVALLALFDRAQHSIYIQTPNLTCEPVVAALLDALKRGTDVTIVTSRGMMLLEQLVTAGTTTSWCIRSLVRRFNKLKARLSGSSPTYGGPGSSVADGARDMDLEAGRLPLGQLRISYFHARPTASSRGHEAQSLMAADSQGEEPVHSHLKLTMIDNEYTLLGSGNMDRASWYTSQELGILFHDARFAAAVKAAVDSALEGRLDLDFDSAGSRD